MILAVFIQTSNAIFVHLNYFGPLNGGVTGERCAPSMEPRKRVPQTVNLALFGGHFEGHDVDLMSSPDSVEKCLLFFRRFKLIYHLSSLNLLTIIVDWLAN
jgi:hypothetical protein